LLKATVANYQTVTETMTKKLFLITGGGTGAKVAEAFVHLCAAGMGPDEAHILLVDADVDNGNLRRASDAGKAYAAMARWPWSVATSIRKGLFSKDQLGTRLFATKLHTYRLAKEIATTIDGGIRNAVAHKPDLTRVLDLFYDEGEQEATCEDGFRARPNLGCLLMADHLTDQLAEEPEARRFMDALVGALAASTEQVHVVVAASVFGGTGASMLPVMQGCVEQALRQRGQGGSGSNIRWSAVKMLPHYHPEERAKSVDPDRFLLDTANALQFYSAVYRQQSGGYSSVYVVGSDKPARNRVRVALGRSDQANPAYFEEFVAALAVLDTASVHAVDSHNVGVLVTSSNGTGLRWHELPDGRRAKEGLGYLLHLAAFYLRHGNDGQLTYGLRQLLQQLTPEDLWAFGWYKQLLDGWASHSDVYKSAPKNTRPNVLLDSQGMGEVSVRAMMGPATNYFGRLMMWAETALKGDGLQLVDYAPRGHYATVYKQMDRLRAADVDTVVVDGTVHQIEPEKDNGLVRVLRGVLVAMLQQQNSGKADVFRPSDPESGRVPLAATLPQVLDALKRDDLHGVETSYTKTQLNRKTPV
jgi:hypothetical protein